MWSSEVWLNVIRQALDSGTGDQTLSSGKEALLNKRELILPSPWSTEYYMSVWKILYTEILPNTTSVMFKWFQIRGLKYFSSNVFLDYRLTYYVNTCLLLLELQQMFWKLHAIHQINPTLNVVRKKKKRSRRIRNSEKKLLTEGWKNQKPEEKIPFF